MLQKEASARNTVGIRFHRVRLVPGTQCGMATVTTITLAVDPPAEGTANVKCMVSSPLWIAYRGSVDGVRSGRDEIGSLPQFER